MTALEIKEAVEGYAGMNEDAFARRFYADRAELESLGIELKVDKPAEGYFDAENYTLPPENFYLSAIEFTDQELGALRTALALLDGEFAYAEPLRLALQQLSWGQPSPLAAPEERSVSLAITATAGGRDLSQRLAKIETAIFRRKTIVFDYYTMGRDAEETRRVDPYQLLFRGGRFYLIGRARERDDIRIFRLSRIRGKVAYASKSEHDFGQPADFDPRQYATRADWQLGEPVATARVWVSSRIDWLVERHFGHVGTVVPAAEAEDAPDEDGVVFETPYADARQVVSWVLSLGDRARLLGPDALVAELGERSCRAARRAPPRGTISSRRQRQGSAGAREPLPAEPGLRHRRGGDDPPERFARLITLAGILIEAAREGDKLDLAELRDSLQVSDAELREDIDLLNVVDFGGGSYVLYAEVVGDVIEVDPEPYGDNFAKPARLLPLEAKALVAAIDLLGERVPAGSLTTARAGDRRRARAGPGRRGAPDHRRQGRRLRDRAGRQRGAIEERRVVELDYYKENEDEFTPRRGALPAAERSGGLVRPLVRPRARGAAAASRLDRIRSGTVTDETFEPRPEIEPDVARLAEHRRGAGLARGARLDRARARPLGARGPAASGSSRTAPWSSSCSTPASAGSSARSCGRPATPWCWSPRTRARPCSRRPRR